MPTTDSPLRYPGGKTKFYPTVKNIIKKNYPKSDCVYIEPFAGGAGLALKLLLNHDVNRIVYRIGGAIVIGISDKTKKVEGINMFDAEKINNFISAPKDCYKPMPSYKEEFLDGINVAGKKDRILLLHIFTSVDQVIRTNSDVTFLRIGDKTKEIKGEDLKNLEYSKSTRHYEDECNMDAEISDLSEELLAAYKKKIGAEEVDTRRVLKARGFIKKNGKGEYLTNAAVLLFAEEIFQFYPNCRIRFLRYDGTVEQVGTKINIIKDVNLEYPLLKIIEKAKKFVFVQLREFTALNQTTGRFQIVPEYPNHIITILVMIWL